MLGVGLMSRVEIEEREAMIEELSAKLAEVRSQHGWIALNLPLFFCFFFHFIVLILFPLEFEIAGERKRFADQSREIVDKASTQEVEFRKRYFRFPSVRLLSSCASYVVRLYDSETRGRENRSAAEA